MKKFIQWMITLGSTIINLIKFGSITPSHIDVGSDQVWPDSGPTPTGHTYSFSITHYSTDLIGYAGGTILIYINSTCDGEAQDLSYSISDTSWCSFIQRTQNQSTDTWTYYFNINSNSGSTRNNSITFVQNGSSNSATFNFSQEPYTNAFDGLTIKATKNSEYGYWVIGTAQNGMGGPPPTYPNIGAVIATDAPITSTRRITYTLTVSRLKNLAAPQSGTSTVTKTLTQTISAGATVKPDSTSGTGNTYYGAYVILTDTSFVNGEWTTTTGTHTTLAPYPSQEVTNVSISNVFIT